jgi:hypothetical protein
MEFKEHHTSQAYYKSGLIFPEYLLQILLIRSTNNVNFHEQALIEQIIGQNIKGGINNNGKKSIKSVTDPARVSRHSGNRLPGQSS